MNIRKPVRWIRPALWIGFSVATAAFGQSPIVPPEQQPISGTCTVSLGANVFQRERCELTAPGATVSGGFLLILEHVSAACSTTRGRGIYTLALLTRLGPQGPIRTTHIPVTQQAESQDNVRLTGAQNVKIYAGSGTSVDMLVSTYDFAPQGHTSCDVSFSGVLQRINQ